MTVLTSAAAWLVHVFQAVSGDCGFMAANLYAKSIFGEDVLANLSIEKPIVASGGGAGDATVIGHVRIRAKSQVRDSWIFRTTTVFTTSCRIFK